MAQPIKTAARAAESNRPRKKSEEKLETAGMMRWLLTYADMITLMLALFIILFAMSTISRVKVQEFAKSVSAGTANNRLRRVRASRRFRESWKSTSN
jgi:chemotaxis protein MotB